RLILSRAEPACRIADILQPDGTRPDLLHNSANRYRVPARSIVRHLDVERVTKFCGRRDGLKRIRHRRQIHERTLGETRKCCALLQTPGQLGLTVPYPP